MFQENVYFTQIYQIYACRFSPGYLQHGVGTKHKNYNGIFNIEDTEKFV